jgi:GNAT superfamily N-acetyltransferase
MTQDALSLHVPQLEELWYRERLLAQPETMAYNRGDDLPFDGYDRETGCIAFPREKWAKWHAWFVGNEPHRFYAYLKRREGTFVGEVNFHVPEGQEEAEMGVVIEARHRGRGYARQALDLLCDRAFAACSLPALRNTFEEERAAALRAHFAAGFVRLPDEGDGLVRVRLTREEYFKWINS